MPRRSPDSTASTEVQKEAQRIQKEIVERHEEVPQLGLVQPEVSTEYVDQARERLGDLRGELDARMADVKGTRNAEVIEKLRSEIKELEEFISKHAAKSKLRLVETQPAPKVEEKEPEVSARELNLTIKELEVQLKNLTDQRLEIIKATDKEALAANRQQIELVKNQISEIKAQRQKALESAKVKIITGGKEFLAGYRRGKKKDTARQAELAEMVEAQKVEEPEKPEAVSEAAEAEAEFFATPEKVAYAKAMGFEAKREKRLTEMAVESLADARIAAIDMARQEFGVERIPFTGQEFQALVKEINDLEEVVTSRKEKRSFWAKVRGAFEGLPADEQKLKKLNEQYRKWDKVVEEYVDSGKSTLAGKFLAEHQRKIEAAKPMSVKGR